ncbi:MAG TPA: hypothetical protein VHD36_07475 [Pirellulales bacterium]|nr:hypothetical protein [Pirellulales bacterium]
MSFAVACLAAAPLHAAPDDTELVIQVDEEPDVPEVDPAAFDNWIFGGFVNAQSARAQIESRTDLIVSEVRRVCDLNAEQHDKLRLAANVELRHIFEEAERLRECFVAAANDPNPQQDNWSQAARFQRRIYRELLGQGTFFAKTLQSTINVEQHARIEEIRAERLAFRRQAAIEGALVWFEESVPLTTAQHEAIAGLVTKAIANDALETAASAVLEPSPVGGDSFYAFYRVLSLPRTQLRQVLDDRQWKIVDGLDTTRTEYEQMLISQGSLTRLEADAIAQARGQ